ncbi:Hypothetical predicted protein [Mytilus galloprovincialis]|uniref:Uncharacterized protein n=1 Tax=Mytilus galloprovincialis TaxID=29158 RepID=A0A8B6EQ29_MYTGA|nr:Hypothetical predicted protein [Mytilus galloprovincialis]VDI37559.1 Hypothetical predicted protein [Mytilus galloprovincialis]
MSGRRASGFVVESLDGQVQLVLPTLTECSDLPQNREELPTPDIAIRYNHLKEMADNLSPLDPDCKIMLLIGMDMTEAHHVLEQIIGPRNALFAQKLPLGWVVIGNTYLCGIHTPDDVTAYLTHLAPDTSAIFERTVQNDKSILSIEDRQFLTLMKTYLQKDKDGNWCSPLPFRTPRRRLPNNRAMVLHGAQSLEKIFHTDPLEQEHIIAFMQKEYRQECETLQASLTLLENVKIRRLNTSISIRDA